MQVSCRAISGKGTGHVFTRANQAAANIVAQAFASGKLTSGKILLDAGPTNIRTTTTGWLPTMAQPAKSGNRQKDVSRKLFLCWQ
jgi:hypothetical protein